MSLTTITTVIQNVTMTTATSVTSGTISADELWIVISGFIIAFVLAFGIGANDVANSFATSVGSKVLTLIQACILASVFETAGAVLIGARVSDTIRKGITDVTLFAGQERLLLVGNVAALSGACIWLLIATFFKMPVSGTHSIVGASVGYALVAFGGRGIRWMQLVFIVCSWVISPLLAGAASVVIFALVRRLILNKDDPLEPGLMFLPFIYALTVIINVFSIFYSGTPTLGFDKIPLWGTILLTFSTGLIVGLVVRLAVVPWMRVKILDECDTEVTIRRNKGVVCDENAAILVDEKAPCETSIEVAGGLYPQIHTGADMDNNEEESAMCQLHPDHRRAGNNDYGSIPKVKDVEKQPTPSKATVQDRIETKILFTFLQILTAIFGSFAHGGNDVSNAIGPLISIWIVSMEGTVDQESATPIWLLAFGGVGISVGLWVLGRRVIETLGKDLTKITPSSGFCIEIGSAVTVLVASNIGIPISTTHCKVGSVVCTGRFRSRENVDWTVFRNIVLAWVVTLPVSGLFSAAIFAGLRELVR